MEIDPQQWHKLFEMMDSLPEPEREALLARLKVNRSTLDEMLKTHGGAAGKDALTQLPPEEEPTRNSAADAPTLAAPPVRELTASRLTDDPHTWTGVFGEPVKPGMVLNGQYLIERQLGEGGMGAVFLARDEIEGEPVALKILKEDFKLHPDALNALREETRKSKALAASPNIVAVYGLNRDRSIVYVKMEYLEGKSLESFLDDDFPRGIALAQALPLISGMCAGLTYAHEKGVIHSDIKPSNIFVTTAGKAKILDFGIARAVRRGRNRYDPGELYALTPTYASLEMLESHERQERRDPDVRDDVYSLACVAYEILTGKHPFERKPATKARAEGMPVAAVPGLSRRQNAVLARALAFTEDKRPASVAEFWRGLEDKHGKRLERIVQAGIALVVLGLCLGGAWFARDYLQQRRADQAFVDSLLKPNAPRSPDADPDTINLLLDQGDDYLKQAQQRFDPALLSEGVSTAYGAYMAALKLDPANRRAAEGALAVVHLYKAQTERLASEGQYRRALELATIALRLDAMDDELKQLRGQLIDKAQT